MDQQADTPKSKIKTKFVANFKVNSDAKSVSDLSIYSSFDHFSSAMLQPLIKSNMLETIQKLKLYFVR